MLGIFDSGIGGLTVVKELLHRHESAGFVYLGDTARTPYGNKSPETIRRYAVEDARFLVEKGATTILVACNTVSAIAMDQLRETFPATKFFEVITPAVSAAVGKKIGVIGTRATIGSGVYERQLKARDAAIQVISQACPLFVPLVEENWMHKSETKRIARTYLEPIRRQQVDSLILGCTHYPLMLDAIKSSIQKRVKIVDAPSALLDIVEKEAAHELASGDQQYFFTDPSAATDAIASRWLERTVNGIRAELK
jgi:glutamate racemase